MLVALTGTMIGFGAFGYSIVKLKDRQWREVTIAMVGGLCCSFYCWLES